MYSEKKEIEMKMNRKEKTARLNEKQVEDYEVSSVSKCR